MKIEVEETGIPDLLLVHPGLFEDGRGFFTEVFRADEYAARGLPAHFVQLNHSGSVRDTVRGLHFQWAPAMGKLQRVLSGTAFLAAVDIRRNSPHFGRWYGREISARTREMLWAPAGFARGFAVLSDYAEIEYLTTGTYNPAAESGIRWDDPAIGIDWPLRTPVLSPKDASAQTLAEWCARPEADHPALRL